MDCNNHQRKRFWLALFCIAAGAGGELHLPVPGLGCIAMFDLFSYVVAIPILLLNWNRMGHYMHVFLVWSFAWTVAAMFANALNFIETSYWFKCVSLASSSWALMAAAYLLLRDYPRGYLWYLVGAGIGGWIAIYYFRNGALEYFAQGHDGYGDVGSSVENLLEKQIYPNIARGILFGCVLPFLIWWRKMPVFVILCATVFAGFYLLFNGGSRSSFGTFCAAAGIGFCVAYGRRIFRKIAKSPMMMLVVTAVGGMIVFSGYKMLAASGQMGESERAKMEAEFGEDGPGALQGRARFGVAVETAIKSKGIGTGWHLRHHSVIANALACEGFVGFAFWIFFYWQCFWFLCHRIPYSGKYAAFIFLMVLLAGWDVFGSPFGTRHKFFVLMTFMALCRDNPRYGVGTIFAPEMLGRRRYINTGERF